ncbi:hypothetical protein FOL47_002912 [Perkinsus chesapeaki]|uniref:Uncharacterized protein n=1 Tax=Perkinsus chesapeaki TaxID=330153 RepID=A0A7J6KMZ9_PERCH|nr:hypothetical protein FOL47_002912 [Perkinsus chesapeaki]
MLEEMGVNRYIFATGYVSSNGSIDFVTGLNASYTRSVGAQIGSSSTLLLALEIIGFRVIDDYKVDGFIFVTSYLYRSLQGEEWGRMIEMVKATRSLKRARSQPVIAPFMFRAENFTTSSLWSDLKSYQPWLYADYAYVLLVSGTVDPEVEISTEWAKNVTNWYMEASSRLCLG